jgi:hypothetical protein
MEGATMTRLERRKSTAIRAQLQALIVVSKSKCNEKETETVTLHGPDVEDQEQRGRSEVVVARGGRRWCIVVDTCFGHSISKLSIVPGIGRVNDDPESDLEIDSTNISGKTRLTGMFRTAVRKARLLGVTSTLLTTGNITIRKDSEIRITIAKIMNDECANDSTMKIPMFGPKEGAAGPVVDVDEEAEGEKLQKVQQKRASVYFLDTGTGSIFDIDTGSSHGGATTRVEVGASALTDSVQGDDDDDDDEPQLLEDFGNRPEKRSVIVRKFVRRNRFLRKVFGK